LETFQEEVEPWADFQDKEDIGEEGKEDGWEQGRAWTWTESSAWAASWWNYEWYEAGNNWHAQHASGAHEEHSWPTVNEREQISQSKEQAQEKPSADKATNKLEKIYVEVRIPGEETRWRQVESSMTFESFLLYEGLQNLDAAWYSGDNAMRGRTPMGWYAAKEYIVIECAPRKR
jgi:hypothetical protein